MRRVLLTGMSGTGKSSALVALGDLGYATVDTDDPGWRVPPDGSCAGRRSATGLDLGPGPYGCAVGRR